jgi:MFS family permease
MVAMGVLISYFINYGISLHLSHAGAIVWRLPFGFQIVPNAIMLFGLLTVKESPRWLASRDRTEESLRTLAFLRKRPIDSKEVTEEFAEIQAALHEERAARAGLGWREAFFGKGNFIR